jgi:thioesterase domain-containing protein
LIAYEMARQLHAQGQMVDLLVLIDPALPASHGLIRGAIHRYGSLLHLDQGQQLNWFLRYIYLRISAYRKKVQASIVQHRELRRGQGHTGSALAKLEMWFPTVKALRYQWSGIYRWVSADYLPGPYPGKLICFWSGEAFSEHRDWHQVSGAEEIEDQVFPGTHMSCKNENLHILAERLSMYLNRVQENT